MPDPLDDLEALLRLPEESARRAYIYEVLRDRGLAPEVDGVGNVLVGRGPVVLAAHYDTVLPPRLVERGPGRWRGPGSGDNLSGVAVLLSLAEASPRFTFAFTVGEEGLGNLKGARHLVAERRPEALIAVDGYLGDVVDRAVGSLRQAYVLRGPGGHAFGARHAPSPARALGQALVSLFNLPLESEESLNVARVFGGGAINALPREMGFWLELRSPNEARLRALRVMAREVVMAAMGEGIALEVQTLGTRPAGSTATPALLSAAEEALAEVGVLARRTAASTDAGAAVEAGIPALGFGVYRGGGAHTEEEWVEPGSLTLGRAALKALLQRLS